MIFKLLNYLYIKVWTNIIKSTKIEENLTFNAYRRIFVLFSLLIFIPNTIWTSKIPDALFNPIKLSFTLFFNGFPNYYLIILSHYIIIIALIFIGFNFLKRTSGIVCFILFIFLYGIKFSFGKIDHEIMYPLTILCLSIVNWQSKNSNLGKKSFLPIPGETLLAILIAFGMFSAGYLKATNWIDLDVNKSGFLKWFYTGYYNLNRTYLLSNIIFITPSFLIELLDYLAVIFELSPFILLLTGNKTLWKIWIVVACIFHLTNTLLLNISFNIHALVYLLFIIPKSFESFVNSIPKYVYRLLIIVVGCFQIVSLTYFEKSLVDLALYNFESRLYFDSFIWILLILLGFRSFTKYRFPSITKKK